MAILDNLERSIQATLTGQAMAAALLQELPNAKPIKVEQSDEDKQKQDNLLIAVKAVETNLGIKDDEQIKILNEILDTIKNIRFKQSNSNSKTTKSGSSSLNNKNLNEVIPKKMNGGGGNIPTIPVSSTSSPPPPPPSNNNFDSSKINTKDFIDDLALGNISTYIQAAVGYGLITAFDTFIQSTGIKLTKAFDGVFAEEFEYSTQMKKNANMTRDFGNSLQDITADYWEFGDVVASTGKTRQEYQQEWLDNSKKGFGYEMKGGKLEKKTAKDQQRMLKNSLNLSTVLDMSASSTAEMFDHWSRSLQLSNTQLYSIGNSMKNISRETGVSGDNMLEVAKKTEETLKMLKNSSNLSSSTAAAMMRSAALASKFGVEEMTSELDQGISSFSNYLNMQDGIKKDFLSRIVNRGDFWDELQSGELATEGMRSQFDAAMNDQIVEVMNQSGLKISDPTKIRGEIYKLELQLLKARENKDESLVTSLTDQIRDIKLLPQQISGYSAAALEDMAKKNIEEMKTPLDRMNELKEQLKTANNEIQSEAILGDIEAIKKSISQSAIDTYSEIMDAGGVSINDAIEFTKSELVARGAMSEGDLFGVEEFKKIISDNLNYLESESERIGTVDFEKELKLQGFLSKEDLQSALLSDDNTIRDKAQIALESISNSLDVGKVNEGNPVEEITQIVKSINEDLKKFFGSFIFGLTSGQLTGIIAAAIALKTGVGIIGSVQLYKILGNFFGKGGKGTGSRIPPVPPVSTPKIDPTKFKEAWSVKPQDINPDKYKNMWDNKPISPKPPVSTPRIATPKLDPIKFKEAFSKPQNINPDKYKNMWDNLNKPTPTKKLDLYQILKRTEAKMSGRLQTLVREGKSVISSNWKVLKQEIKVAGELLIDGLSYVRTGINKVGDYYKYLYNTVRGISFEKIKNGFNLLSEGVQSVSTRIKDGFLLGKDAIKGGLKGRTIGGTIKGAGKGVLAGAKNLATPGKIIGTAGKTGSNIGAKVATKLGLKASLGAATGGVALALFAAVEGAMGAWQGYVDTPKVFASALKNADGSMKDATVGMQMASTYSGFFTGALDSITFGLLGLIGIKEPLQKLFSWIVYTPISIFENLWTGMKEGFADAWGTVKPLLSQTWESFAQIGDVFFDLFKSVGSMFGFGQDAKNLGDLFNGLGDMFVKLWTTIGPIFKFIGFVIGHMLVSSIKAIIPWVKLFAEVLTDVANIIGGVIKFVMGIVGVIWNVVKGIVGVVKGIFTGDWGIASSALDGLINSLKNILGGLGDVIWGILKGVFDLTIGPIIAYAATLFSPFYDIFTPFYNIVKGVKKWFYDLYMWLVGGSLIPDLVNGIMNWMSKLPGIFFKALFSLPKIIGKGIFNIGKFLLNGVVYAFKTLPKALDFVGDIFASLFDSYLFLPKLIWNGLKGLGGMLWNGLKGLGGMLWDTLKPISELLYNGMANALQDAWDYFLGKSNSDKVAKNVKEQDKSIVANIHNNANNISSNITSIEDPIARLEEITKKRNENDQLHSLFRKSVIDSRETYENSVNNPGIWGTKNYFTNKNNQGLYKATYEGNQQKLSAVENENRMLAELEEKTLKEIEAQSQSNLIQEGNSTITAETMKMGQKEGSIYTHDTHSEYILKEILNALLQGFNISTPKESKDIVSTTMLGLGAFDNNFVKESFQNITDIINSPNIDNNFNKESKEIFSKIIQTPKMLNLGAFDNNFVKESNDELVTNLEKQEKNQSSVINTGVFESDKTSEAIDVDGQLLRGFVSANRDRNISVGANMYTPEDAADYVMQQLAGSSNPDSIVNASGMEYLTQLTEEQNLTLIEMLDELRKFNSFKSKINSEVIGSESQPSKENATNNQFSNYKKNLLRGNWQDLQVVASSPQSNFRNRPK